MLRTTLLWPWLRGLLRVSPVGSWIGATFYFIGLKQVHRLSSWRTTFVLLFAMLLPVLIALAVALLAAILIAIILVAKHFMH